MKYYVGLPIFLDHRWAAFYVLYIEASVAQNKMFSCINQNA